MNLLYIILFFILLAVIINIYKVVKTSKEKTNKSSNSVVLKLENDEKRKIEIDNVKILGDNTKSPDIYVYGIKYINGNEVLLYGNMVNKFSAGQENKNVNRKSASVDLNIKLNINGNNEIKKIKDIKDGHFEEVIRGNFTKIKQNSKIPKRIVQTYKTEKIKYNMFKASETFINNNPGYTKIFYSDSDCRKFLDENFEDKKYLDAFDSLIPGAYKADIFRLAEIYINGGIYADISMVCLGKLEFEDDVDVVFVYDVYGIKNYQLYNAFIAAVPKAEPILFILDEICTNILKRKHTGVLYTFLSLTGPEAVGISLNHYLGRTDEISETIGHKDGMYKNYKIKFLYKNADIIRDDKGKEFINTKYNNWMKDRDDSPHYFDLFLKNLIYKTKILDRINEQKYIKGFPKNIIQTMKTKWVSSKMHYAIEGWKNTNPDYNYYFFGNKEARELIKDNFDEEVLNAFDTLIPGAYKADLFRVCALYVLGGVYADADTECLNPMDEIFSYSKNASFISVADSKENNILNSFMISKKENPLLKAIIEYIVNNVKNRVYLSRDLDITGPGAIGNTMRKFYKLGDNYQFQKGFVNNDVYLIKYQDMKMDFYVNHKYYGYDEERKIMGGDDYSEMYKCKKIYKD